MHSKKCSTVMNVIRQNGINVKPVCVDSKDVRNKIKSGSLFKVRGVPTIVVINDSQAEIYEGNQVLQWFDQLINNVPVQGDYDDYGDERYDDYSEPQYPQDNHMQMSSLQYKPLRNAKEKQMDSVKDIAKKMELERKRMLPDEDKLPKY